MSNKSTAAQRSFIASLVAKVGDNEKAAEIMAPAFRLNQNRPWDGSDAETVTQATGRITKTAASMAIDLLKKSL